MTLQMQMFHGGGAEDDEDAHPEAGFLEGDGFDDLLFFFLFVFVARGLGVAARGPQVDDAPCVRLRPTGCPFSKSHRP